MNRIERTFSELRKKGKSAFIAFLTAGYPELATTEKLVLAFAARGVDIIELGIPFSDPLADGPLIQDASVHALKNGVTPEKVFAMVRRLRQKTGIPICFMTYYNPVFVYGEEQFIARAVECGVDGVIIPDLPLEEGAGFSRRAGAAGLDTVFFVSPTTEEPRLKPICLNSRGFIYYVSLSGVTGPRAALPRSLAGRVRKVKSLTDKPVCVGFGVSSPEQVRLLSSFADGVIVGSAIIRRIRDAVGKPSLVKNVSGFVAELARGTNRG